VFGNNWVTITVTVTEAFILHPPLTRRPTAHHRVNQSVSQNPHKDSNRYLTQANLCETGCMHTVTEFIDCSDSAAGTGTQWFLQSIITKTKPELEECCDQTAKKSWHQT